MKKKSLKDIKEIDFFDFNFKEIIPHIFVIKAKDREGLRNYLILNGVECGVHYKPNHLLSKYLSNYKLPITEKIYSKILTLPCHNGLDVIEQNKVISTIKNFYE